MQMQSKWKHNIGLAKRRIVGIYLKLKRSSDLEEIGRMLGSMMAKAGSFCGAVDYELREETDYGSLITDY